MRVKEKTSEERQKLIIEWCLSEVDAEDENGHRY